MNNDYVKLERACCPVCTKVFDSGGILLHKRFKEIPDEATVTHMKMCPEHKNLRDQGYVALVGADPEKSEFEPSGLLLPHKAHRTGEVVHVRREVLERLVTGVAIPSDGLMFAPQAVIDHFKELKRHSEQ